ncbi:MAG: hypothetical protein KF802_02320 [Bdellovibrionaceae bacterium]|nr:hypothetical protein [Pseudobdellovibrionaceae bacterium]
MTKSVFTKTLYLTAKVVKICLYAQMTIVAYLLLSNSSATLYSHTQTLVYIFVSYAVLKIIKYVQIGNLALKLLKENLKKKSNGVSQ